MRKVLFWTITASIVVVIVAVIYCEIVILDQHLEGTLIF